MFVCVFASCLSWLSCARVTLCSASPSGSFSPSAFPTSNPPASQRPASSQRHPTNYYQPIQVSNNRLSPATFACMRRRAHDHVLCLKPLDIPKTEASFNYPLITALITCHAHIHHSTSLRTHARTHTNTQVYSPSRLIGSNRAPIDQTDMGK